MEHKGRELAAGAALEGLPRHLSAVTLRDVPGWDKMRADAALTSR